MSAIFEAYFQLIKDPQIKGKFNFHLKREGKLQYNIKLQALHSFFYSQAQNFAHFEVFQKWFFGFF